MQLSIFTQRAAFRDTLSVFQDTSDVEVGVQKSKG